MTGLHTLFARRAGYDNSDRSIQAQRYLPEPAFVPSLVARSP